MKAYLKVYLGRFLLQWLLFPMLLAAVGGLSGLWWGLLLAAFMAATVGSLHILSVRRLPYGKCAVALEIHHRRETDLQLSHDTAFDSAVTALRVVDPLKVLVQDRLLGKVAVETARDYGWLSGGEIVSLHAEKVDDNRTRITVSSRPRWDWPLTLVDCGKNLDNVERILAFLKQHAGPAAITA